jgi:hypothetical protein
MAEDTLILPDSQINVNGVDQGDVVSVQTIDVNVTDGTDPVTPDAVSLVGNTLTIEVPASSPAPVGATLMKTGQTTSFRTGDDGDLEAGRATNFTTLGVNNPFGNTNRFTDELGGSTYTNNIVIDWSTYDNIAGTVLGYYRSFLANATWDNQIDACLALSIGTFTSGWRLWNNYEAMNVCNFEPSLFYNYSPFNISSFGGYCHTSTNRDASFTYKVIAQFGSFSLVLDAKSNVAKGMAVRTFTVTGTTLT